jgi:uncharacterized membrane protein YfcA
MPFEPLFLLASTFAGAIASISGFGIGSLLTPLLAGQTGSTKLAIALVAVPHFFATSLRLWMLRRHIHTGVLVRFGSASAAGGIMGAFFHSFFSSPVATLIFALVLLLAGTLGISGLSSRLRFKGAWAWIAGILSGFFGGLVGNQGGIRSAALLGFEIDKKTFVATATAVGVVVDLVRMPVYFWSSHEEILSRWPLLLWSTAGVIAGTFLGHRILNLIEEQLFRKLVSLLIFFLGLYMLAKYFYA